MRFRVKTENIENEPGTWCSQKVTVMDILAKDCDVGEYVRNYPVLYNTFCPFEKDGRWYALYSKEYTATRVMTLPECEDIGGEEAHPVGFCPVDYYVPHQENPTVAFVSGCIWGDDTSWKIQVLDISDIANGNIVRKNVIPTAEYCGDSELKDVVTYWEDSGLIEFPMIGMYQMGNDDEV